MFEISFQSFKIFNDDLASIELHKQKLVLNRPIYVGFSVLDLSKTLMYDFHYNYVKSKYGSRAQLLFTDTDSLCYEITTDDLYHDLKDDKELFDFSAYPRNHSLYDASNKKIIGKMKDETESVPVKEFVGLRSKMYSMVHGNTEKQSRYSLETTPRPVQTVPIQPGNSNGAHDPVPHGQTRDIYREVE